ncbi:alpha-N-arabinofuranosidase [Lysinibacter sp. HNR]|uniref:arabinosylfuranosidase ArfA n=1 Tax=Lysinibacter sp. HNR TaxID=3031408 RepID=UPI002436087E|nr:alpha-N-arabinofuranosidase [Lysinibacter sp. HNR]WGD37711.1 alpha-N-arabinofuranosidase [Lysinibacter sp. HNR]
MEYGSVSFERDSVIAPVNRRLFGVFVEHLGRCVYEGIYEPGHPSANEDGFRTDVIDLVRELGATAVRYPGGNFVSGYRWEDGVGPREKRPVRRDLAWHSLETNQVGLDEFARWCTLTNLELMMAVNLGTRGVQEALDLLEYSNHPSGTTLSDLRIANGSVEPHDVRMWCLGNEMDGPWQIGHLSADDYGKLAARTASAMKMADPNLELVACGSSGSAMPTFGEWERVVLEHCYEHVDYVSCHAYYQERESDLGSYLASSLDMQHFIEAVAAAIDHVQHKLRSKKEIKISFDEWNIWYMSEDGPSGDASQEWSTAPRLLENAYSVADAVVFGSLLITLLKNSNRVTSASLAQLVNVIAPIMTEPGGDSWRQTTFYPFAATSRLAQGNVLRPRIIVDGYNTAAYGEAPLLDAVATHSKKNGSTSIFLVNRTQDKPLTARINVESLGVQSITEAFGIHDEDAYAQNVFHEQNRVRPIPNSTAKLHNGILTIVLPPISWTAVSLSD